MSIAHIGLNLNKMSVSGYHKENEVGRRWIVSVIKVDVQYSILPKSDLLINTTFLDSIRTHCNLIWLLVLFKFILRHQSTRDTQILPVMIDLQGRCQVIKTLANTIVNDTHQLHGRRTSEAMLINVRLSQATTSYRNCDFLHRSKYYVPVRFMSNDTGVTRMSLARANCVSGMGSGRFHEINRARW